MRERIVSPRDCALLVAVPLTWEAFRADSQDPKKDYAKHVLGGSTDVARVWENVYEPRVVAHVSKISRFVVNYGVHYVPHATIVQFADALSRFPIVALITHSRLCELEPTDVHRPDLFLAAMESPQSELATKLSGYVRARASHPGGRGAFVDGGGARIAAALNALIRPTYAYFLEQPGRWSDDHQLELPLTRLMLEAEFPDSFTQSRSVEFFDGLATLDDIVSAVPRGFAGVLDLSICNSAWIGDIVKNAVRRRYSNSELAFPGLVIGNAFPADPQIRLIRFDLIAKVLSLQAGRYSDVAATVHRFMMKGVR